MLRVHYEAPGRTVTPTQLAEEVGFKEYGAANLHYGRLARRLCEFLGLRANALELGKGGRRLFSTVLVRFEHLEREWEWTMRPRVARALEQIGWCGGRQGLTASQELQKYEETYRELPETTKKRVIESRLGQGYFRANLLSYWKRCALTGCRALDILKASHIKPWRESTNPERLDRFNGLLLTPNLDALFDRGLMTFQDDGAILVSPDVDRESLPSLGIDQRMRIRRLAPRHLKYLRFHREKVFIKG